MVLTWFLAVGCETQPEPEVPPVIQSESAEQTGYRYGAQIDDPDVALLIVDDTGTALVSLSVSEFLQSYDVYASQFPPGTMTPFQEEELRRGVAEEFVGRSLMVLEAGRMNIGVEEAWIEAQLENIRRQMGGQERMERVMADQGLPLDSLRRTIRDELLMRQVRERMSVNKTEPTEQHFQSFRQGLSQQARVAHILFPFRSATTKEAVLQEAERVLDLLEQGADFGQLAREYSKDSTAVNGGDLGFVRFIDLDKSMARVVSQLTTSESATDQIVATSRGYHIVRLLDKRTVPLMDEDEAHEVMKSYLERENFKSAYESLRRRYFLRLNPEIIRAVLSD